MELAAEQKIWQLIKDENTALLVTVGKDGSFDSRPMGCAQKDFDGTLWFLIAKGSPAPVRGNQYVLVSYTRPSDREYVSISGRARIVDDPARVRSFWKDAFRVWFPEGPESSNIALLAIDVEMAKSWTKPASYTYHYLPSRAAKEISSRPQIANLGATRYL
jgi:general stress protein 26